MFFIFKLEIETFNQGWKDLIHLMQFLAVVDIRSCLCLCASWTIPADRYVVRIFVQIFYLTTYFNPLNCSFYHAN